MKSMKYIYIALLGLGMGSAVISCSEEKKKTTEEKAPDVPTVDPNGLRIAYYSYDSLIKNYTYWFEQDSILKVKQLKFEKDLMYRQNDLQKLAMKLQEHQQKMDITAAEMAQIENNLNRKNQQAQNFQQTEGTKLQKEAMEIQTVITNRLEEGSKKYCEKYGLDVLLIQAPGGQIGFINPKMDVTKSFIEFLNAEEEKIDNLTK